MVSGEKSGAEEIEASGDAIIIASAIERLAAAIERLAKTQEHIEIDEADEIPQFDMAGKPIA